MNNFFYFEVKPGFQQYTDEVIEEMRKSGLSLVAKQYLQRSTKFNEEFYAHIRDNKELFDSLDLYMNGKARDPYLNTIMFGPSISMIFTGDDNCIETARALQGSTRNPAPNTFREKYALTNLDDEKCYNITYNGFHCSDSHESAIKEIGLAYLHPNEFGATAFGCEIHNRGALLEVIDEVASATDDNVK